jgi:hypothetical protein
MRKIYFFDEKKGVDIANVISYCLVMLRQSMKTKLKFDTFAPAKVSAAPSLLAEHGRARYFFHMETRK